MRCGKGGERVHGCGAAVERPVESDSSLVSCCCGVRQRQAAAVMHTFQKFCCPERVHDSL